ncbi:MAG: HAD family hydrolase [Pyrinomonadaceae bacterium]|nr:HAD family hydrolase [Pyrinomonadaceae bacterium]
MYRRTENITTLLFDWDGTIADSAQLGLTAFQKSFDALGFAFPQEIYETAYSPNWYSIYEAMGLPKETWATADDLWMQHYGKQTAKLIEGVGDTLRQLHHRGYRMGIVSSGTESRLTRELRAQGLTELFDVVICNEQMINKKPHPEGLLSALGTLNRPIAEACYVGDSPEDIEMGKRAQLLTAGVRSTYPTSWRLREANPDIYLESFSELTIHFPG